METKVSVNGKLYIVPAQAVAGLVGWLEQNAVDASKQQPMHESVKENKELLLENSV